MRRLASAAVLALAVAGVGLVTAPAANACTGTPCDEFCLVWKHATTRPCPIR